MVRVGLELAQGWFVPGLEWVWGSFKIYSGLRFRAGIGLV